MQRAAGATHVASMQPRQYCCVLQELEAAWEAFVGSNREHACAAVPFPSPAELKRVIEQLKCPKERSAMLKKLVLRWHPGVYSVNA